MATASIIISLPPPPLSSIFNPKPQFSHNHHNSSLSNTSPLSFLVPLSSKRNHSSTLAIPKKSTKFWRTRVIPGDYLLSEADPVENSQQMVSTTNDGVTNIITVLLLLAFVGLSILTIGVIYIAVTDFLGKREREKFEKEEAEKKKKKSGRKGKLRTRDRAGPRGFGQKFDEDEDKDAAD